MLLWEPLLCNFTFIRYSPPNIVARRCCHNFMNCSAIRPDVKRTFPPNSPALHCAFTGLNSAVKHASSVLFKVAQGVMPIKKHQKSQSNILLCAENHPSVPVCILISPYYCYTPPFLSLFLVGPNSPTGLLLCFVELPWLCLCIPHPVHRESLFTTNPHLHQRLGVASGWGNNVC